MTPEHVQDLARDAGFELDLKAARTLGVYTELLIRWNAVINLTGARDETSLFRNLIVDSLHLAEFMARTVGDHADPVCWDLGSGAGLPGIPLRCLWQAGKYTLVESREKRVLFMKTVLARCPLPGTGVFQGRAEVFMQRSGLADIIVSRAFMPWQKLLPFIASSLAPTGRLVLLLNEPIEPDGSEWDIADFMRYPVESADRYFMALRRK